MDTTNRFAILFLCLGLLAVTVGAGKLAYQAAKTAPAYSVSPVGDGSVSLQLSPVSQTIAIGSTGRVEVDLDTAGHPVGASTITLNLSQSSATIVGLAPQDAPRCSVLSTLSTASSLTVYCSPRTQTEQIQPMVSLMVQGASAGTSILSIDSHSSVLAASGGRNLLRRRESAWLVVQ